MVDARSGSPSTAIHAFVAAAAVAVKTDHLLRKKDGDSILRSSQSV